VHGFGTAGRGWEEEEEEEEEPLVINPSFLEDSDLTAVGTEGQYDGLQADAGSDGALLRDRVDLGHQWQPAHTHTRSFTRLLVGGVIMYGQSSEFRSSGHRFRGGKGHSISQEPPPFTC
jgi:hypothetical protein